MPSCTPARSRAVAGLAALAVSASLVQSTSPAYAADTSSQVLASTVVNPSGSSVRTTFLAADVSAVPGGRQGSLTSLPGSATSLPAGTDLSGVLEPDDGRRATTPSTTDTPYQRFDVPATGNGQVLVWQGRLDPTRELVLSAWDGARWEELGRTRGATVGDVTLEAAVAARHRHNGVVPVLLTGEDPFADDLANDIRDSFESPSSYDFAFVHHTDTQYVTRGSLTKKEGERDVWRRGYTDATKWVAANARSRKIVYAAHTGDVVDQWYTSPTPRDVAVREFAVASAAQKTIDDSGVITSVLPGNHDNVSGSDNGPGALFNTEFGPSRYQALAKTPAWQARNATYEPWRPGDNANSVVTFTAGGLDFVAVSMGFKVTEEEAAWADSVFKRFPDRNGVLLAHSYLTGSAAPDGRNGGTSSDGFILRDKVVARNPNVALVLSGHENGVNLVVRKDLGRRGNHVVEMLGNYQHYNMEAKDIGTDVFGVHPETENRLGASFLRLLQFDVDRSEVSVDTYSPFIDDFGAGEYDLRNRYDGREDDFRVPVQLTSRTTSFSTDGLLSVTPTGTQVGTATVGSGKQARVTWDGLGVGTRYGWQATTVDAASGKALSTVRATFVARSDSSDVRPPVLQVPGTANVAYGSTFDPMAGVRARDEDGSDLTRRVEVSGEVDTTVPGSTTLVYSVSDEAGNQSVAARTVKVAKDPAPVSLSAPVVSGRPEVGQVLSATRGSWSGIRNADLRVQWLRNGKAIDGATGSDYRVVPQDVDRSISVRVEARVPGRKMVAAPASNALTVLKMTPTVRVTLPRSVYKGKRATLSASWYHPYEKVAGTVRVRVSGKVVATKKVAEDGTIRVKLPKWKKVGKKKVVVELAGSSRLEGTETVKRIELKLTKAQKKALAAKKKAAKKKAKKKKAKKKS